MVKRIIIIIFAVILFISCSSTARLYTPEDRNRVYSGTLDHNTNLSLRQLLARQAASDLKDTIIIKYDYNNEGCWDLLDQKEDNYVQAYVTRHKERIQMLQLTRPNVSVFNFREPGNKINKIKKWDSSIMIDSTRQLMNMLFKERSVCGNSIIVLPDKRFVYIRSDSHSEAMDLAQNKILEYLTKD